jgi:nucleotide-binding universal stress UspA family protein
MNGKFTHMLLCTDGSDFSEGAIREGLKLAKEFRAKITAFSVIDFNPEFDALAPDLLEKMEEEAASHVRAVKERAEKDGILCSAVVVRSENPYLSIAEEASKIKADLIVVGRRGKTGLKRLLMGSVTKRVIGHAPCNVLVVPRNATFACKNILIATDGSKYSDHAAAEAVNLARGCGVGLVVMTAVHAESSSPLDIVSSQMHRDQIADREMKMAEENIRKVKELAENAQVKAETLILSGSAHEVIVQAAKERDVDLIVMGSHGRTGFDRLLVGSVAERVIGNANCAVLVVKAAE